MKIYINRNNIIRGSYHLFRHYDSRTLISFLLRGKVNICSSIHDFINETNSKFDFWEYGFVREDNCIKIFSYRCKFFWRSYDNGMNWSQEVYIEAKKYKHNLKNAFLVCNELESRIRNSRGTKKPHGDISPNNILINKEKVYFIDNESEGFGSNIYDYITYYITSIDFSNQNNRFNNKYFELNNYIYIRIKTFLKIKEKKFNRLIKETCLNNMNTWKTKKRELGYIIWKEHLTYFQSNKKVYYTINQVKD